MSTQKFSSSEAIKFGWETTKKNLGFFVGVFVTIFGLFALSFVVVFLLALFSVLFKIDLSFLSRILGVVVQTLIGIGWLKIALKFNDNEKPELTDLLPESSVFFKIFIGSLLYALIVVVGAFLLIVPGIIWAIKFQFFPYFILEKKSGIKEAFKQSAILTQGVKWQLFLFGWLCFFINLLGFLSLLLGLIVTVPTTMIANAFIYRRLLAQTETTQAVPVPPSS